MWTDHRPGSFRFAAQLLGLFATLAGVVFAGLPRATAEDLGLPSTSPVVVSAAAFSHVGCDVPSHVHAGSAVYWYGPADEACLKAPVQLPLGAQVVSLWASFDDTSPTDNAVVSLERLDYTSNDWVHMGQISSYGSGGVQIPATGAISNGFVDTRRHSHFLRVCLYEDTALLAAGIGYTDTFIFMDRFERGDTTRWSLTTGGAKSFDEDARRQPQEPRVPKALLDSIASGGFSSAEQAAHTIITEMKAAGYGPPIVLPAAGLTPQFRSMDFSFNYPGGWAQAITNTNLYGPLYLPDGATMTSVFAVIYDNDPGGDPLYDDTEVSIRRKALSTGVGEDVTRIRSTGADSDVRVIFDLNPDNPVVEYPTFAYNCGVTIPGPLHRFYSIIVYYTLP